MVDIFTLSFSHFFIPAQRIPPHFLTSHGHFWGVWCLFFWHCIAIFQLSWTLFTFKLSFFICHLSFSAAHVIPSLISLHGAPCIIITLCPAGKLRFTVYRNYGCWCGVLASSLPASHWYFLHFFRKTFGGFTLIYLFCNCLADFEYVRWAARGVAETWIQLARWTIAAVVAGCLSPQGERDWLYIDGLTLSRCVPRARHWLPFVKRTFTNVGLHVSKSGKLRSTYWRWRNRDVHVGDLSKGHFDAIAVWVFVSVHSWCHCTFCAYYPPAWANWLLIPRERFTRARGRD